MMKTKYIKPMTAAYAVSSENFICNSKTTDSASIGGTGSPNEKEQPDIQTGGPGVAGSKENLFGDQYTPNLWED